MRTRLVAVVGVATATLAAGAVVAAPVAEAAVVKQVKIQDFAFGPQRVQITKGDRVRWTNRDGATHSVTSRGGSFDEFLGTGESFAFTFRFKGTYRYFCTPHPFMTGSVVVS